MSIEQVKVSKLASEFGLKSTLVISELKKIGVWVPSATTQVDTDIANRIRRRLQLLVELQEEAAATADKPKEPKKKAAPVKARKTIKQLGRIRKGVIKKAPVVEEEPLNESPLSGSLKPRKGKAATYRRVERPEPVVTEEEIPVTLEELPSPPVVEVPEIPAAPAVAAAEATPEAEKPAPVEPVVEAPAAAAAAPQPAKTPAAPARPVVPKRPGVPPRRPMRPPIRRPMPRQPRIIQQAPPHPSLAKPKAPKKFTPQDLTLSETLTVKEFSEKISIKSKDVLRELISMGVMANINQTLDRSAMEALCERFKVTPTFVTFEESVMEESHNEDQPKDLHERPPVVTVMGHVDHGKTSLLDAIRHTKVAAGEAGGITQHIGAYHVDVNRKRIVFLDTPGHEAFTLMRSRGAQATDIVVLVVAADDGIMPQTREAIDHARAAGVPILVAINKIDKPEAQPDRVKQQLSDVELVPEEWGGDTVTVEVSAVAGTNLDLLLEMIGLVSEVLELKANPDRPAHGVVLEAKLDRGRGAVATILVQNGTLKVGDYFIAGSVIGKVRAMFDDRGEAVQESGPGSAVEILGLQGLPAAGDTFQGVTDAAKARQVVEYRRDQERLKKSARGPHISLDELYAKMATGEVKELPLVVKADTQGSVEAVTDMLQKIKSEKVKVRVIHSGVGAITESDVLLATASDAIVVGFNVRPEKSSQEAADKEGIDIRLHTVIYDITEEIEQALVGLLGPTVKEVYQGRAEVRDLFRVPKYGVIAGCYLVDGVINRNSNVRLLRDNVVIHEGKIDSLRRFKEDVAEVKSGYECGISLSGFNDLKLNDIIEAHTHVNVAAELN